MQPGNVLSKQAGAVKRSHAVIKTIAVPESVAIQTIVSKPDTTNSIPQATVRREVQTFLELYPNGVEFLEF